MSPRGTWPNTPTSQTGTTAAGQVLGHCSSSTEPWAGGAAPKVRRGTVAVVGGPGQATCQTSLLAESSTRYRLQRQLLPRWWHHHRSVHQTRLCYNWIGTVQLPQSLDLVFPQAIPPLQQTRGFFYYITEKVSFKTKAMLFLGYSCSVNIAVLLQHINIIGFLNHISAADKKHVQKKFQ